ncbi:MAG: hypothetical protein HC898_10890 [Phycisphaerales bacterium]|nr:hypothetical protein [Phycisphaerales bacterium]
MELIKSRIYSNIPLNQQRLKSCCEAHMYATSMGMTHAILEDDDGQTHDAQQIIR